MRKMVLAGLIIYLMKKNEDYDITIRVREYKKRILVVIDTNSKEEPNEGDKNPTQTT